MLGHLDFQGEGKPPVELRWQYCCNCEHFCPIDFDRDGLQRCPICTRRSSLLYVCDRCYTISFESNTPLNTKNFTVTADGTPKPSCPGCLKPASADLREHTCDALHLSFTTALNTCPVCQERLDVGPSFPSSVAAYLRRTRAANKVYVTFDYGNEVFAPVDDGEFVLIRSTDEALEQAILPRAAKFAAARDFYEFYQDFFLCAHPNVGEVHVIEPAIVVRTSQGWKFGSPGRIEMAEEKPKPKPKPVPAAAITKPSMDKPKQEAAPSPAKVPPANDDRGTPCRVCGTLVESKYAFCWKCGNSLTPTASVAHPDNSQNSELDDEPTVQHEPRPMRPSILSMTNDKERKSRRVVNGSMLKLMMLAVVAVLVGALGSIGLFLISRSSSGTASANTAEAAMTTEVKSDQTGVKSDQNAATTPVASQPQSPATALQRPADDELKQLREKRMSAKKADRPAILKTFNKTEKKYPNDYRFPYERAKFAVDGDKKTANHEAFSALSTAAELAIASGKSREMLDSLQKDSAGDFHKLAREHEWLQLQQALKNKDPRVLNARMGM